MVSRMDWERVKNKNNKVLSCSFTITYPKRLLELHNFASVTNSNGFGIGKRISRLESIDFQKKVLNSNRHHRLRHHHQRSVVGIALGACRWTWTAKRQFPGLDRKRVNKKRWIDTCMWVNKTHHLHRLVFHLYVMHRNETEWNAPVSSVLKRPSPPQHIAAIEPIGRTSTVTEDSKHKMLFPSTRICSPSPSVFFMTVPIAIKKAHSPFSTVCTMTAK